MKNFIKGTLFFGIGALFTFTVVSFYNPVKQDKPQSQIFYLDEPNKEIDLNKFSSEYRIIPPNIPDNVTFCGEEVPLNEFEVRERFQREIIVNTYWHSASILLLQRSTRWFPIIEPILKENGIPNDFKYLAAIESNLTNAVSPAGATGFWQFMKGSGKEYGLEINDEVDERYHLEKATIAACKYLKDAKEKFGTWTLAAASYNRGMSGIDKQLERQKEESFYDMLLNEETSRYIFRILAMKELFERPRDFGFYLTEDDFHKPIRTKELIVNSSITHLGDFAKKNGISYKLLKYFNPWLRDNSLTNKSKKEYTIKIPYIEDIYIN